MKNLSETIEKLVEKTITIIAIHLSIPKPNIKLIVD